GAADDELRIVRLEQVIALPDLLRHVERVREPVAANRLHAEPQPDAAEPHDRAPDLPGRVFGDGDRHLRSLRGRHAGTGLVSFGAGCLSRMSSIGAVAGRSRPFATRCARLPEVKYSKMRSLSPAHRSCVRHFWSSWQFSLPRHWVVSIGSSTARMTSATETSSRLLASRYPPPGPRT